MIVWFSCTCPARPLTTHLHTWVYFTALLRLPCSVAAQGAATQCYVAVNPAVAGVSGKFFMDNREAEDAASAFSKDEAMAKRLWEISEKLTSS